MGGKILKDQRDVSSQRPLPVEDVTGASKVLSVSGETGQFYYYNSGTLTIDAGQAAGVVVVVKLAYRNILNAIGSAVGTYNDKSLSFTSTAFTTEVAFPYDTNELHDGNTGTLKASSITSGFANGTYCVDYRTGTLYGVKASTQTSLSSVAYKTYDESVVVETGDIEIGAVELKDGSTDTRAIINAANTARSTSTPVVCVQNIGADGTVGSSASDVDDAAFTVATDKGQVIMGINTSDSVDSGDKGAIGMTTARELKTFSKIQSDGTNPARVGLKSAVAYNDYALSVYDMSNPITLLAEYSSPFDFTATYTSSTTITITGTPFTVDDSNCLITGLMYKPTGGSWVRLCNGHNGVSLSASSGVITVTGFGTPFASGDTYRVAISYQRKSYDSTTDTQKTSEQSPLSQGYVADSLLDTTNIAAATNYYPASTGMSMDGYKDMSLSGKFIDADGTMTLTVEAMNDEDTTNGDWVQVYGYDSKNNTTVNSLSVTNSTLTYTWDFDNFNYSYFRVKMVNDGATNTGIIKMRRKGL